MSQIAQEKFQKFWENKSPELFQKFLESVHESTEEKDVMLFYLTYLCISGNYDEAKKLIDDMKTSCAKSEIGYTVEEILNDNTKEFNDFGTVLHTALYFNPGKKGYDFFKLFYLNGAKFTKDYYGCFPWTQEGILFIAFNTTEYVSLGDRIPEEFDLLYSVIEKIVKLDEIDESVFNGMEKHFEPCCHTKTICVCDLSLDDFLEYSDEEPEEYCDCGKLKEDWCECESFLEHSDAEPDEYCYCGKLKNECECFKSPCKFSIPVIPNAPIKQKF